MRNGDKNTPSHIGADIIERVLRKPEVREIVGLSDPTIWRMESAGRFPKRLQLGGKAVGWLKSEIDGWLAERAAERAA
jgi:prophage regulatory protein